MSLILKTKKSIREYFFVIIGLLILTLIIFRELLPNFSSAIIGDGYDGVTFLWNFWWVKKSILELHQPPFFSDYMFFPFSMDLRLHTLIFAPAFITLPIQLLWGPIVALNIYVLSSFVLSGLGVYLLAKFYIKSRSAAFLAAIIFAFNTYVLSHAYGHFNLTTIWPIPFVIYFLEKSYEAGKIKYGALASFCYLFLIYSDLQYSIFTALLIFLWVIWKVIIAVKNKKSMLVFTKPLFIFSIFVIAGSYPLFSLIASGLENNLSMPAKEAIEFYSPDILAYIIPPQGTFANKIAANFNLELAKISFSGPEWATYFGIAVIALLPFIFFRLIWKREGGYVFWAAVFVMFFILSLGPELHFFNKNTEIVLPFNYIHNFPLINMARVPVRIVIIAILAISILTAKLLSSIKSNKKRYAIVGFFSLLYMAEIFSLPVYTQNLELPKAYAFFKERADSKKANESIIEFPLFFTDRIDLLGKKETMFIFYQTFHEYKMVNGYLSYTPVNFLKQYIDTPGMLFLIEPLNYGWPRDKDLLTIKSFLFDKAHVKYAILHKNMLKPTEFEYLSRFWQSDLEAKEVYNDQDIVIYRAK